MTKLYVGLFSFFLLSNELYRSLFNRCTIINVKLKIKRKYKNIDNVKRAGLNGAESSFCAGKKKNYPTFYYSSRRFRTTDTSIYVYL